MGHTALCCIAGGNFELLELSEDVYATAYLLQILQCESDDLTLADAIVDTDGSTDRGTGRPRDR